MDYREPPGSPTPLVEDAHSTALEVFSFYCWFSFVADCHFSNYHFWLAAGFLDDSTIRSIRNIVEGLERRLANYLLLL